MIVNEMQAWAERIDFIASALTAGAVGNEIAAELGYRSASTLSVILHRRGHSELARRLLAQKRPALSLDLPA